MKSNLLFKQETKDKKDILPSIAKTKDIKEYKIMNKTAIKMNLLKKNTANNIYSSGNTGVNTLRSSKVEVNDKIFEIKSDSNNDKIKEIKENELLYSKIAELEKKVKALELSNQKKDLEIEEKQDELHNEKQINYQLNKENELLIQKNHTYQHKLRQFEIERNCKLLNINIISKKYAY